MRCETIKDMLEPFIEKELDKSQQQEVENHLLLCEACKKELALTQHIPGLVKHLPKPVTPENIISDVLERLDSRTESRGYWLRLFRYVVSRKMAYSVAMAAIALAMLFGIGYQKVNIDQEIPELKRELKVSSVRTDIKPVLEKPKTINQYAGARATSPRIGKKPKISDEEIKTAEDQVKIAIGIVVTATKEAQSFTLAEGLGALDLAKMTSEDTIRVLSNVQDEIVENFQRNLTFLAKNQDKEINKP